MEAQIADPLWLLTRQWQMGEFQAENAGSPIRSCVSYFTQGVKHLRSGAPNQKSIPLGTVPLEASVEAEGYEPSIRDRVKTGQLFERLLRTHFSPEDLEREVWPVMRGAFLKQPTKTEKAELDQASEKLWLLMAGQVLDGPKIGKSYRSGLRTLPPDLGNTLREVYSHWLELVVASKVNPPPAMPTFWKPESLDYQFEVETKPSGTEPTTSLEAPSYRLGELDWYTFTRKSSPLDPKEYEGAKETQHIFVPTKMSAPGMPHSRWWDFEDSEVHFGQMEAGPADIGQLMFLQFGLLSSDDWFLVPVPVPVNSLTTITKLEVIDVFGSKTVISRAYSSGETPLDRWALFELDVQGKSDQLGKALFVPSAVPYKQESAPLEEVRFLRDEGANMVWAVEQRLRNKAGKPVDGFEAYLEGQYPSVSSQGNRARLTATSNSQTGNIAESENGSTISTFHFASPVPANWIPFISQKIQGNDRAIQLRRAAMIRNTVDGPTEAIPSLSTILNYKNPNSRTIDPINVVREEAVPRAGVNVQLTKQRARWIDGSTVIWLGRKVVTGRGEGNSGLKFDFIKSDK